MTNAYIVWTIFFSIISVLATAAVLYYYLRLTYRTIPIASLCLIFISIFVSILPFPLLVLDVDAAKYSLEEGLGASVAEWYRGIWCTIMVVTQITAWVLLPIAQEYDRAGDFSAKSRFYTSIKNNVKMYVIMGVVGGALLGYIVFLEGLYSLSDVIMLCLAMSNAFGLALICIFLASGMIGVPKMLWMMADPEGNLRRYYFDATDSHEDLEIAAMDMVDMKAELVSMNPIVADEHKGYLGIMIEKISNADREIPLFHNVSSRLRIPRLPEPNAEEVSLDHLVELHTRVKHSIKVALRMNYIWESTLRNCERYDAIVASQSQSVSSLSVNYWRYMRKPMLRVLSTLCWGMSLLVLWSELVLPFQSLSDKPLNVVEIVVRSPMHFFGSVVFLFYMAGCCYWATFQFKVLEVYHLLPSMSDATSFCFTCTFLTRLIMPLCYNFLWAAKLTDAKTLVEYSSVFRKMNVVAFLGSVFNKFMPLFIPLIALLIQLKVFDRILAAIGLDRKQSSDVEDPEVQQKINDGKRMILVAMGKDSRSHGEGSAPVILSSSSSYVYNNNNNNNNNINNNINMEGDRPERGKRYEEYKAKRAAAMAAGNV